MLDHKWYAALAYVRANRLNRTVIDSRARFGIMTAGKAYLDVRQALTDLGLDEQACSRIGIRVMKVGCVWPLDAQDARRFATGLEEILVVEEKRQILEYALKEELYNWRDDVRPRIFGKYDEREDGGGEWSIPHGRRLLPAPYELSPALIAKVIASRLERVGVPEDLRARMAARLAVIEAKEREAKRPRVTQERKPWFCSGCPHNTSTVVPTGSRALAGIGCHYLVMGMNRNTDTFSQMGGEGVPWLGQMHFTDEKHVFANLGDGTYFHSGLLAIRAAIAARANITYKILYNDAVAMTGGQAVDGTMTVQQIAHQVTAEGASRVVIVSDEPAKYAIEAGLPQAVVVHHRDLLDTVQRELRQIAGTSVLIYEQTCATEKRRRRKRGKLAPIQRRAFINDAVCEGCGDCSVASNCLSVEPLETPLGTKRRINQFSCNTDLSCTKGFCPSFVTTVGAQLRQPEAAAKESLPAFEALPVPAMPALDRPYRILVAGIGGTGIVTIGALLGMAAHLERRGVTALDMTGLAQKGGAVFSHIQIASRSEELHASRIATGEAQLLIGCDALVAASAESISRTRADVTRAIVNTAQTATADFLSNRDWRFPGASSERDIRESVGGACEFIDASALAVKVLGDSIYTNPLLLGYAWQKGWIPISAHALLRAIELNGVAVEKNQRAFQWGRYIAVHGASSVEEGSSVVALPETLDGLIRERMAMLTDYQNAAYAAQYGAAIYALRHAERAVSPTGALPLTEAAARNLAKLMAYKDEYEIARLYADPAFMTRLRKQFQGEPGKDYGLSFHLAPPLLAARDAQGRLTKKAYGAWMLRVFRVLAHFKRLRGTPFDLFGHTAERRMERRLVQEYRSMIDEFCSTLTAHNVATAVELARLPEQIRSFGHVKELSVRRATSRRQVLLDRYRSEGVRTAVA